MSSDAVARHAAGFLAAVTNGGGRLAAVLVVAVLAICALSANSYLTLERELTDSALARREAIGSLAATTLAEKLARLIDVATSFATRPRVQDLAGAGRWTEAASFPRNALQDFDCIDRVFLADVHGTLMADVPELPGARGANFAHREWFEGVSRDWKPYVSQLHLGMATPRRNAITVSVPIRSAQGDVVGIFVLQVKLESFLEWVRRIDLGPEGRVLVVDREGQVGFDSAAPASSPGEGSGTKLARWPVPGAGGVEIARDKDSGEGRVIGYASAAHGWGIMTMQPVSSVFGHRDALLRQLLIDSGLIVLLAAAAIVLAARLFLERRRQTEIERAHNAELRQTQQVLAKHAGRLRIVHDIDRAIIAEMRPEAIAAAVLQTLRELLGVPRAIVNMFDFVAGEVEWLAAAGRHRTRVGGVRYPLRLMGDMEALRRGEPQWIDVHALPPGPEVEALLASGVHFYVAVPMIAGGELIGSLSFGGEQRSFPAEQIAIAQEVATQLAIAIAHTRLLERVKRK